MSLIDPPSINKDASPTPLYSIVGNRKPVTVTCSFYGKPVPTVIMVVENGTEIARGNSLASYTLTTTTENDFGKFNCSAENPYGKAEYTVELRKAGICMHGSLWLIINSLTFHWQKSLFTVHNMTKTEMKSTGLKFVLIYFFRKEVQ